MLENVAGTDAILRSHGEETASEVAAVGGHGAYQRVEFRFVFRNCEVNGGHGVCVKMFISFRLSVTIV